MNIWLFGLEHLAFLPVVSPDCPWFWDNLTCWQPARLGEVVEVNCPELFSQFMSEEDYGLFLYIYLYISDSSTAVELHWCVWRVYCK